MTPCAAFQDGKYDRLLRLLYDDIEKYETEVTFNLIDFKNHLHALHCRCACCLGSDLHTYDMCSSKAYIFCECWIDNQIVWLIDWFIHSLFDWLVVWFIDWSQHVSSDRPDMQVLWAGPAKAHQLDVTPIMISMLTTSVTAVCTRMMWCCRCWMQTMLSWSRLCRREQPSRKPETFRRLPESPGSDLCSHMHACAYNCCCHSSCT